MNNGVEIFVKSHIARDLLQTAGLFGDVPKAAWEYVVNGLEYVDPGTNPIIRVSVEKANRRITVCDNGRGMDLDSLRNYFVLHGENIDRKAGRPGRDVSVLESLRRSVSLSLFVSRRSGAGNVALPR